MLALALLSGALLAAPEGRLTPRLWADQLPGGLPAAEPAPSRRERRPERWSLWRAVAWHGGLLGGDLLATEVHLARDPKAWEADPLPGMHRRSGRVAWMAAGAAASVGIDALAHRLAGRRGSRVWRGVVGAFEGNTIAAHVDSDWPLNPWDALGDLGLTRPRPQVLHEILRAPARAGMRPSGNCLPLVKCRGGGPCVLP